MKDWNEFFHCQHAIRERKKRKRKKQREKKEVISSQITPNHDTHAIQRERGCQDESNDVAESRL